MFRDRVSCYPSMARPQVADEGHDLLIWRVAAVILNRKSRIVNRGRHYTWVLEGHVTKHKRSNDFMGMKDYVVVH